MKKVFLYSLAIALTGLVVACNSNKSNVITVVPPAQQANAIDSFNNANGLNLSPDTAAALGGYVLSSVYQGNPNRIVADSIPVIYFKLTGGYFLNSSPFYLMSASLTSGADLWVNLATGIASSQDAVNLVNSSIVYYYLTARLGEGGSVTFITPSYFAYGNATVSFSSGATIPPNTPLFYSNITIDSIRSH